MTKKSSSLTPDVLRITRDKGTEPPFSGKLEKKDQAGTYLCRQCGLSLFRSSMKFHSGCGWPSFDEEIPGHITKVPDQDGQRTEIICPRCQAHLGHVFSGERFTVKNIRHCVNSLSLDFVSDLQVMDTEEAIFAAGCFWGVEYYLQKLPGVLKTEVGYTGGRTSHPSYEEVCRGDTGHYEAIRIVYDPEKLNYEALTKYFFEIHDPSQTNGQGPDIGERYKSVIFYQDEIQKNIARTLIETLQKSGTFVATQLLSVSSFWLAEEYHQDYYTKNTKTPYCHTYTKRF